MATALASGLISVWGVVWSVTWLVLQRPQWDAKRVQRRKKQNKHTNPLGERGRESQNDHAGVLYGDRGETTGKHGLKDKPAEKVLSEEVKINENLRRRTQANGDITMGTETNGHAKSYTNTEKFQDSSNERVGGDNGQMEYYWQSYPDNIKERIPWVMDLIMNFRGPGWNWAIPPLPDLPRPIKIKLAEPVDNLPLKGSSSVGLQQFITRSELFYATVPRFLVGYFLLDVLKVVMMKDPYYIFGPNTYALPPHLASLSPVVFRIYREALSALGVIVSLYMAFSLMPLYMGLLHGPRVFGLRAEPWYFPSYWGSLSNITDKGLNGLWGGWWHQTFRFVFAAPTNYLIKNGYVKARSTTAKIIALLFAFGISGFLHAGASISQPPKTYPWAPPIFFMLQALGIYIQSTLSSLFAPQLSKLPNVVWQAGNVLFTCAWLFSTGWILVDDFSRGGVWLYEPIPISPLRGLGFGVEGDGWWCWEHIGVAWYKGKHWWESGIAL